VRTVLFLPASNPRAIEKARGLVVDAVVLDLEDAVAADHKAEARARAVEAVQAGGFQAPRLAVRVNGLDTPWGRADLKAVSAAGPDAVLAPKVDDAEALAAYGRALAGAPERTRLWAMIETCRGVLNLPAIAASAAEHRLTALVAGVNDLAKDMRCRPGPGRAPLLPALAQVVTAGRAHGLAVLDGVYNALADEAGLRAECVQGRDFGFDGKCLIHPDQIAVARAAFGPDAAELAWARAVVEAFGSAENVGKGAIRVDGRMVERLHLVEAERLLGLAAEDRLSA
jgi:citrate lyase subunit beta/citryl-CoA lyase